MRIPDATRCAASAPVPVIVPVDPSTEPLTRAALVFGVKSVRVGLLDFQTRLWPAEPLMECSQSCQGWGRGFESLRPLQRPASQIVSAISVTAKKPNCRSDLRVRLGGRLPYRSSEFLSERRILSEAWGLADLLYKLFSLIFQRASLIAQP
jgi:hypothetical protein